MINVGISGQSGFIGTHLCNTIGLRSNEYKLIQFKDEYFETQRELESFVSKCDVIVHLAAINRHNNPDLLYQTNITMVTQLITALEDTQSTPHVIFASSIQEELDNKYGLSKRKGRLLLEQWADKHGTYITSLLIPNVFGPFGKPFFNSVVATFCHQLTHCEKPTVLVDSELQLIYVGELIKTIINFISSDKSSTVGEARIVRVDVPHSKIITVAELLDMLVDFQEHYFKQGIIPNLTDTFTKNLFNTFVCYINHSKFFPYNLKKHSDARGWFVELVKLNSGGQVSFSTTVPGITRGNHFHTRKAERFAVIKGKAKIELRKIGTDKVLSFELDGKQPSFVDMPIWYTHNITNVGDDELYTIFWINEEYDPADPDTYYEEV